MTHPKRILIADDEPAIADTYATLLRRDEIETLKAYDGEECIEKAKSSNFDLILLDVNMPKLNGYEVIARLKLMPHLKHTPVVFLTGFSTTPADIESGYKAGATEFWKKPMATEELEARVRALLRVADAQKQLREMQESFTAMIVHDLRGPLGAITGFAELMAEEKEKLGADTAGMVDQIGLAARTMLSVVSDFLEITRLEMGELQLSRVESDLRSILDRCLSRHSATLIEKTIGVKVLLPQLPYLHADADKIERLFEELVDNAIRFTPTHGWISIEASLLEHAIKLDFRNSGAAIAKEDLRMLFDKMRITTPGAKRPGSKTGLGLPICRAIVEAHGGTITASSKEGDGTTISITLPLAVA